jgi:photosystem II stability/assembly factor-like uncharacterized protein
MRPICLALAVSAALTLPAHAGVPRSFDDAALHAVQFVDPKEGWAVGDEGVVWHTVDGGETWERQPTGLRASLRSIHFLSPYIGWIAGREELPHNGGSVGVLLFTQDGGLKWRRVATNALPGLQRIRFLDPKIGFVVGDGTEHYPSGLFTTADAGRTWEPVRGPRTASWMAADFRDAQTGVLAGAWSRLAAFRQGALVAADVDTLGGRTVRGLQMVGNFAVAVGQGGLVLLSRDSAGVRWGYADLGLPSEVSACLDFHGVCCAGDQIWVVGRPGSVVLHSPDRGENWEMLATGQPLPLHNVFFLDGKRGWAVGEFGSILATTDGGKNWRVQHRGGQRAAVLLVNARAAGLPVDTVAVLGAEESYLATGVRVFAADPASAAPERASEEQRFAAALRQSGGAAGEVLWQFPLPLHLASADKSDLMRYWDRLHADRAAEELVRQLVLVLRIWRPAVVLTDHPDPRATEFPGESLVAEALHEAFARAADPRAFPEQLKQLGLQPWEVAKVYGRWDEHSSAQVRLDTTTISPRLETTPRDYAAPAAGLLFDVPNTLPGRRFYRLLDSRIAGAASHQDLMQGVDFTPGGVARRAQAPPAELAPGVESAIRTRRNLQALAEAPAGGLTDPNKSLALVGSALTTLPENQATAMTFAVASHYARTGQWALARELYLLLVDRYPAHPLAADAYRWLIRHNTSSEARRRHELGQFLVNTQVDVGLLEDRSTKTAPGTYGEAVRSGQIALLGTLRETRQWFQGGLEAGKRLAAFGPLFATDPATQFCLQSARRQLGDFDKAREWYAGFRAEHSDGPWSDAAASELWLLHRSGQPAKPVVLCRQTPTRPLLDGNFEDTCWQGLKPIVLRNAVGDTVKDYTTEAWLAYDKDFLYLALRCRHPAERFVEPVKVRTPDADLRPYDRVSLLLDLDRDYTSYFHLQVDQRGCVHDACVLGACADRSWNPRWFVAVRSERDSWQIEAAIPMIELTGDTITLGHTWACNLVRVLPGRGVQAWSLPADVEPRPEGMGLLMFAQEPSRSPDKPTLVGPTQMPKAP